ncbi:MAG: glycosyltransferase family 39 protein [Candidatus Saccharimonadales bacterium]
MIRSKFLVRLLTIFNIGTLSILAVLALATALHPTVNKFGLFQPVILIFFGAILINIILIAIANVRFNLGKLRWLIVPTTIVIFIGILVAQLFFAQALLSSGYTWDSNTVFQAAVMHVQSGVIDSGSTGYFQSSPNNLALFFILDNLFSIMKHFGSTNFLWGAVVLNVAVTFLTQIIIYFVVKMLFGRRTALCSLIVSFVLIGLNLHIQTPYTDTLAILFPILIFLLGLYLVKFQNTGLRLLFAFLIGAATIMGTLIKPTVVIAAIALVAVAIIWAISERKTIRKDKLWLTVIMSFIVFFATAAAGYIGYGSYVDSQHILPYAYSQSGKNSLPPEHFINIGTKTKINGYSVNYGGYDGDTAGIVSKLDGHDAKVAYSDDAITTQLRSYGMLGYLDFLKDKLMWIMSDGTFFAYGEGDLNSIKFENNSEFSQNVRQFTTPQGKYYALFGNILQAFWVAVLFLIALQLMISILWKPARLNLFLTMLHLMIVGIIVFLLIFEGRSRYIFLFLPIFIVTAMYTLNWFRNITREDKPQNLAKPPTHRSDSMIDSKV